MKLRIACSAIAIAALSACAGGDSSGAPPVGAAPAPAPAPTPTPTPTPSVSYDAAYDFSTSFRYGSLTASLDRVGMVQSGEFVQSDEGRALDVRAQDKLLVWDAPAATIAFDFAGNAAVFGPTLLEREVDGGRQWSLLQHTPYRVDVLNVTRPRSDVEYAVGVTKDLEFDLSDGSNRRVEVDRHAVGGSFTEADDLPTAGTASYALVGSSTSPTRDGAGGFMTNGAFDFTFSSTDFTADIPLEQDSSVDGNAKVILTARLRGTYNPATGRIESAIDSPDSNYTGGFVAAFFGPRAEEIGIVFTLAAPSRPSVVGRVTGNRTGS